jgi:hypothetical protein
VTPAFADSPAKLGPVGIRGDAAPGATLTAAVVAAGDPAPRIGYEWARCVPDQPDQCLAIPGANSAGYTVSSDDVAHSLIVRVTAKNSRGTDSASSGPTAVVVAAPTDPTAPPPPTSNEVGINFLDTPAQAVYLQPFPVIRVAGSAIRGGAYIHLLRVSAPAVTHVAVNCAGPGCPVRRLSRGPGRIRRLERFLPAGVAITIRATRAGYIGKYVSLVIRSHAAPKRRDACLLPGDTRPVACPA